MWHFSRFCSTHKSLLRSIHSTAPQSWPVGIIAHVFRPSVPTFQSLAKHNKEKIMFATGKSVGLDEWKIDDSCLVWHQPISTLGSHILYWFHGLLGMFASLEHEKNYIFWSADDAISLKIQSIFASQHSSFSKGYSSQAREIPNKVWIWRKIEDTPCMEEEFDFTYRQSSKIVEALVPLQKFQDQSLVQGYLSLFLLLFHGQLGLDHADQPARKHTHSKFSLACWPIKSIRKFIKYKV